MLAPQARPDNRLALMDHACLELQRATGSGKLMQGVWLYEHPVDFHALRRFHSNFGYGLFGRRIERSPLPFGRHRWVSSLGPPSDIDFAERARPRAEVGDWADERAALLPVDPEWGAGWHLGVLPLTDGSTAITLLVSHCLADGVGALHTVVEAVCGDGRNLGYPPPQSRPRLRGAWSDLVETAKDAPEIARTVVAAGKLGLRHRHDIAAPKPSPPPTSVPSADGDLTVALPAVWVIVDRADWDDRARSGNGNSYSLVAGFTAKLAEHLGRRRADGAVSLLIALNDRASLDDTRAQAMVFAQAGIDPTSVTTDLTDVRIVLRQAVKTARDVPDEMLQLLPLVPLLPRRALRGAIDVFFGPGDQLPVSCSNLGDIHPAVARLDGTDAEYLMLRGVDQNIRRADIERAGGQMVVVAGRIGGKISIGIVAYQIGAENSKRRLRELAAQTLAQFDLTGEVF